MYRTRVAGLVAALALLAAPALAFDKGTGVYGLTLGSSTADLYSFASPVRITAYDHTEMNFGLQYWRMVTNDYATTFSAAFGWFSETNETSDGSPDVEYKQWSWRLRFGGDRVVRLTDRALLYVGPGFEYWNGDYQSEGAGPSFESQNVARVSLTGRVGAVMMLSNSFGINCDVNARVGQARVEDDGAKAVWWPSGVDGTIGLVFTMGD